MCIQYVASVGYGCGHYKDENSDFVTCDAVDNGEACAGTEQEPAPSAQRPEEDCPDCVAAAEAAAALALATSPSTEPEPESGLGGQNRAGGA